MVTYTFDVVLEYAIQSLRPVVLERLCLDRVEDHAPLWHVYGVLGHMHAVWQAAIELRKHTQLDVVSAALLHDIGKLGQVASAFAAVDNGGDPGHCYISHEAGSASIARALGLGSQDCAAIRYHHFAYLPVGDRTLIDYLNDDATTFRRWMLLCAADAVGKGRTANQRKQRVEVAEKIFRLSQYFNLPSNDPEMNLACGVVMEWEPPPIPKFS